MANKPDNNGKKWNDKEVKQLINLIKQNMSENEIAKIHKRTKGGIHSRIKKIVRDCYENKKYSISQISEYIGLSEDKINNIINKENILLKNTNITYNNECVNIKKNVLDFKEIVAYCDEIKETIKLLKKHITSNEQSMKQILDTYFKVKEPVIEPVIEEVAEIKKESDEQLEEVEEEKPKKKIIVKKTIKKKFIVKKTIKKKSKVELTDNV